MKSIPYAFIFSLLLCLPFMNLTANAAENKPDSVVIKTYEEDVTGDGVKEIIKLKGVLLSGDSSYYHQVWADISSQYGNEWKISYEGGYNPELIFEDLTHDKVTEVLYESATSGDGGLRNYRIHSLKEDKVSEIPLPVQRHVEGTFHDEFQARVQISPDRKSHTVNIKDRASEYIQLGIYDEKGKLKKPTSLMKDPIAFFETKLIGKSKGLGLKSYQQINGAYHEDKLGTIETLWYYENGEWIILKTDWIPSK